MAYWIILALLLVVALGLIIAIAVTLKKNSREQDEYEEEYDKEEEEYVQPVRRQQKRQDVRGVEPVSRERARGEVERRREEQPEPRRKKTGRQWKVILENLDTWEKFEFIFYDNVGIGRGRGDGEFEKFLTVREDPRVSKIHCVIVRREERLYLKDVGSRNGTFLNGQRIHRPVEIQRDDVIGVGETKIEVKKVLRERE